MTTSWTLQFIADHPVAAFFLSWPATCVIVTFAWLFAQSMENAMNLILRLANLAADTCVILFRGYAPQSAEAHPEDEKTPPPNEIA